MPALVSEKMGIKAGIRAFFVGTPPQVVAAMQLPALDIATELSGKFDYIHHFVKTKAELDERFTELKSHLAPAGKLWVSWPKGGQLNTDLNIKEVIAIGYRHGLVESINLRIDDTWTALKFTWPKPDKVYNNSYGQLPR